MEKPDGPCVTFDGTVTFQMNGSQRTVTIVGDDEADPAAGLLSFSAPLSRALMDAEPGDKVDFANVEDAIEILCYHEIVAGHTTPAELRQLIEKLVPGVESGRTA